MMELLQLLETLSRSNDAAPQTEQMVALGDMIQGLYTTQIVFFIGTGVLLAMLVCLEIYQSWRFDELVTLLKRNTKAREAQLKSLGFMT